MVESILTSIKKLLGIEESAIEFDAELLIHINSVFSILSGFGLTEGFTISDSSTTWGNYFVDIAYLELVKTYMYLRVRLLFDPPQNSFLVSSIQKEIEEFGWRINTIVENKEVDAANAIT